MDAPFDANGAWVLEDRDHEELIIRRSADGAFRLCAWAENWGDIWEWTAVITEAEVKSVIGDESQARALLLTSSSWRVNTPSSVPREDYIVNGTLSSDDGFQDGGRGGKW